MKRLSALLVFAGGLCGVSAWGQAPVKPALQTPAPRYLVRYLCFTITPRPGALFPEAPLALPPILKKLHSQYGWSVPLTSDPERFLARLRREEPRYTFRFNLASQSALVPDAPCHLLGGPRPDDPQRCRVDFTLSLLSPDTEAAKQSRENTRVLLEIDPTKVDPALRENPILIYTHMKGGYRWALSPASSQGMVESGMDDTSVPQGNEQMLGRTKDMGLDGNATHQQTAFVYCVVPG